MPFGMTLLLAGCTGQPGPGMGKDPLQMLALGDSYTIGESVDMAERWPVA